MADCEQKSAGVRLIELYRKPQDEAWFLERYERVHAPLLKATPHVRELRLSPVLHHDIAAHPGFFLMAELLFDDPVKFAEAMCSREKRVANADLKGFAVDPVRLIVHGD